MSDPAGVLFDAVVGVLHHAEVSDHNHHGITNVVVQAEDSVLGKQHPLILRHDDFAVLEYRMKRLLHQQMHGDAGLPLGFLGTGVARALGELGGVLLPVLDRYDDRGDFDGGLGEGCADLSGGSIKEPKCVAGERPLNHAAVPLGKDDEVQVFTLGQREKGCRVAWLAEVGKVVDQGLHHILSL